MDEKLEGPAFKLFDMIFGDDYQTLSKMGEKLAISYYMPLKYENFPLEYYFSTQNIHVKPLYISEVANYLPIGVADIMILLGKWFSKRHGVEVYNVKYKP